MTDTYLIDADGYKQRILNLGWLNNHSADIERVDVYREHDDAARVYAVVNDGRIYHTLFADIRVCRTWFGRRKWRGVPITFH